MTAGRRESSRSSIVFQNPVSRTYVKLEKHFSFLVVVVSFSFDWHHNSLVNKNIPQSIHSGENENIFFVQRAGELHNLVSSPPLSSFFFQKKRAPPVEIFWRMFREREKGKLLLHLAVDFKNRQTHTHTHKTHLDFPRRGGL